MMRKGKELHRLGRCRYAYRRCSFPGSAGVYGDGSLSDGVFGIPSSGAGVEGQSTSGL